MRNIPQNIEQQLEKLGLYYNEQQALFIYADGGVVPPNFISERIARRIGTDKYLQAWALLTSDQMLDQFAQSNLRVQIENLPAPIPTDNRPRFEDGCAARLMGAPSSWPRN